MATRNCGEIRDERWAEGKLVCVGLDSDPLKIPACIRKGSNATASMLAFNREIIDSTKDKLLAYKPNLAFYLAYGDMGLRALAGTVAHIREVAPGVVIILDLKDGDIGNTNNGYVQFAFDHLQADAVTVNPYLGVEAMKPFLDRKDKGIIVLCRTSNPGAGEFQDLPISLGPELLRGFERHIGQEVPEASIPFYQYVAYRVATQWNANGNCSLVVGATFPEELAHVRRIVGDDMAILSPGAGKQGADVKKAVRAGMNSRRTGLYVNASSSIIFASSGPDFAQASRCAVEELDATVRAA